MNGRSVVRTRVVRVRDGEARVRNDRLAGEEPLEIRAGGPGQEPETVAVTMRTPGHDFALAVGFLFGEGLVAPDDIVRVAYCDTGNVVLDGRTEADDERFNIVTVRVARPFDVRGRARRFMTSSACGICGSDVVDDVMSRCTPITSKTKIDLDVLLSLPERMRTAQSVFEATGGLHAAALFDGDGTLDMVREDIGRHNAVDKIVGDLVLGARVPAATRVLAVSGRAGFEIVQKAAAAGIPVVASVSAPSSLAVDVAERAGITLAGFVRGNACNLYSHPERVRGAG